MFTADGEEQQSGPMAGQPLASFSGYLRENRTPADPRRGSHRERKQERERETDPLRPNDLPLTATADLSTSGLRILIFLIIPL